MLTEARRAHLRRIGKLGGMTSAATTDVRALGTRGATAFRQTFQAGHGCTLCPAVDLPADIDEAERDRRADLLYRMHFVRLGQRRA